MTACSPQALLVALLAGLAPAAASKAPEPGCLHGSCPGEDGHDDLGLLQKGRAPPSVAAVPNGTECLHGGRWEGGRCACKPYWLGSRCQHSQETALFQDRAREACGLETSIFPYSEEPLWGSAYPNWGACAGARQSPINIITDYALPRSSAALAASYGPRGGNLLVNTGHSLKVHNEDNNFGTLCLGDEAYTALHYHFHTPSEHTVNGLSADMEMHIVHRAAAGSLAVVAILFDLGATNPCLGVLPLGQMPRVGCEMPVRSINLRCFGRQLSGPWWSYAGSLTTPPCSEGVAFNVMQRRATVSPAQLRAFTSCFANNARAAQKVNGRPITMNTAEAPARPGQGGQCE